MNPATFYYVGFCTCCGSSIAFVNNSASTFATMSFSLASTSFELFYHDSYTSASHHVCIAAPGALSSKFTASEKLIMRCK